RLPVPPAAARDGDRPRRPLDDEVPGGPRGRPRGRPRDAAGRPPRAPEVRPERPRRGPEPVRLLARPPRGEDPGGPDGAPLRQRRSGREVPLGAPEGGAGPLPRAPLPPGVQHREAADAPRGRDDELRPQGRTPDDGRPETARGRDPRGEPGRGGEPDRAPRLDDPRVPAPEGARGPRDLRRARPVLRGDRGRGGPHRGPPPRPRIGSGLL